MSKVDQALRLGIRAQPVALYNADCIAGMASNIPDNSIDMIFTDPPYGIKGETLDVMYNRDDSLVIKGYVDVSLENYADWSLSWIKQCERVLRPGGSMYIVSGYTNLHHILNALHSTSLNEVNHLIAHYSFGVYTKKKWVSSHYHVLFWEKPETKVLKRTFNTHCLFSDTQQSYLDRLSVQKLPRHYKSRVNDPAYAGKTKALIGALADQNEEFMPLGPEWEVGTFASRIGDHGAYAGTFTPEDGKLYIDWLGMNSEGNLNDPETRQKLLDQWYRMGVKQINYKPETDTTVEAIPHLQLGKVYNGDGTVRYEEKPVQSAVHMPKTIPAGWKPTDKYGIYKKMIGGVETEGTIDDVLNDGRERGKEIRKRLFTPLIESYEKMFHTNPDTSSFGSVTVPTPTPTTLQDSGDNAGDYSKDIQPLLERRTSKPPKTPVPAGTWRPLNDSEKSALEAEGKIISRIHPDYHSNIIERFGLGTPIPESSASNMTMPTPTPTPTSTPVKPVLPTTLSQPTPTPTPTPGGFTTPAPTIKPEGITTPSPTPKSDGFSVPKIQSNNSWFNFAIHPAIKQP